MKGRMIAVATPDDRPFAAALLVDGRLEDHRPRAEERHDTACARPDGDCKSVRRKPPKSGPFLRHRVACEGLSSRTPAASEQGETVVSAVASLPDRAAVTLTVRRLEKGTRVI